MGNFTVDINKFAQKANANADLVVRKVVAECATSVIEKSPVDTGRFRANWQHGVGSIPTMVDEPAGASLEATLARIEASVQATQAAGAVHYIANSLPYAQRIENGWSKQAPFGIVARTAVEFQSFVDRAIAQLSK